MSTEGEPAETMASAAGFGRPSAAAASEPELRTAGEAADSAYRAEGASSDWFTVRAASVAGVRHRLAGHPGQDSYAWMHDGDRIAVAVADGLGSVGGSAQAAGRAVRAAVRAAIAAGDDGPEAVRAGLAAADAAAAGGGATTILVAVVAGERAHLGRVGDSTAFLISSGGQAWGEVFEGPADDDSVAVETAALPGDLARAETAGADVDPESVLVLVTDGLGDPWRDGPATVAPALSETLAEVPAPVEVARLIDFSRQGCHDDRTLVAIWARQPGLGR